jgi:hypothetical protein
MIARRCCSARISNASGVLGAAPVGINSPETCDPSQAATAVWCPRRAISRSSVHSICSAPPQLASLTGNIG